MTISYTQSSLSSDRIIYVLINNSGKDQSVLSMYSALDKSVSPKHFC